MLLFIRMIPESVTRQDMQHYVAQAFRSPWARLFGRQAQVKTLDILKITDEDDQTVEFHALADIEPTKSALLAIRRLNRIPLLGRRVAVRKYYTRSDYRDRRGQRPDPGALSIQDRRTQDRRRPHLQREWVQISGPAATATVPGSLDAGERQPFGVQ